MENTPEKDLASIRQMMERSARFLSLSGLSGVLAGCYALAGVTAAFYLLGKDGIPVGLCVTYGAFSDAIVKLSVIGLIVLAVSLVTAFWFSIRKARRREEDIWNASSRRLLVSISVPLITGGILIVILLATNAFPMIMPVTLIFYGIALFYAGEVTYNEIRYLGLCEIILGLAAVAVPGYSLIIWAVGFGVLHIIYGTIMYRRYER